MRVEAGLSLSKADRTALYLWAVGEVQAPSRPLACLTLPDIPPLERLLSDRVWSVMQGRRCVKS